MCIYSIIRRCSLWNTNRNTITIRTTAAADTNMSMSTMTTAAAGTTTNMSTAIAPRRSVPGNTGKTARRSGCMCWRGWTCLLYTSDAADD